MLCRGKFVLHAMKEYEGLEVLLHLFLILALAGGELSVSFPCHSTPRGISRSCWESNHDSVVVQLIAWLDCEHEFANSPKYSVLLSEPFRI
jgi:hypothetical protein